MRMATPKKKPIDREKYRKPHTPVRIRHVLAEAAKARSLALAQDLAQYVNDAVRMRLEAEGAWPPPSRRS